MVYLHLYRFTLLLAFLGMTTAQVQLFKSISDPMVLEWCEQDSEWEEEPEPLKKQTEEKKLYSDDFKYGLLSKKMSVLVVCNIAPQNDLFRSLAYGEVWSPPPDICGDSL